MINNANHIKIFFEYEFNLTISSDPAKIQGSYRPELFHVLKEETFNLLILVSYQLKLYA